MSIYWNDEFMFDYKNSNSDYTYTAVQNGKTKQEIY